MMEGNSEMSVTVTIEKTERDRELYEYQYPRLMNMKSNKNCVVLFVEENKGLELGDNVIRKWPAGIWELFTGKVTLENEEIEECTCLNTDYHGCYCY